jgi:type I restriction enzyme S subunit
MTSNFPSCPLGDITQNFDAARRPVKASDRRPGPYPYYGAQGIVDRVDGYLFDGQFVLVAEDGENLRSRNEPIALLATGKFWVNNHAHILRGNAKADTRFLFYAINASDISGYVTGSTIPKLSQGSLNRLRVPCPSLDDQQAIASILGAFDDKIELNYRMNETLEATARTIFKDWFVDYGPTRAKMEGLAPYLATDLWALFPDRLGADDRPEGWKSEAVLMQASWINGAAYKNMHFVERALGLPVVKIAELKSGVTPQTKFTNTDLGEKYRISDGEVLFSWSGNPDTSIDTFIWTGGSAWLNQHIFAVRDNGHRKPTLVYAMLKWLNPTFAELARNKQTTGLGHVTREDLGRLQVVVPPSAIELEFDHIVGPILERLRAALFEARTLAAIRDVLLPKLMSGEISIKEATNVAEASL